MNYFTVYDGAGVQVGVTATASKAAAKLWVSKYVLSTHMGEWRKTATGWEYATTIGRYYRFERTKSNVRG